MPMNNGAFAGSRALGIKAAEKKELALVRPLGCCERFFYLYSLAFPVHFSLVAEIQGTLDSARLAAALEQVRTGIPRSGSALSMMQKPGRCSAAPIIR
ncbi:hypothetical protein [Bradyrhizobium sp. McL0615]|uniref:hypothetical protein n=1 Tax=Bradyrhizobium sp. McL0615 TaxID=3415673 RepID=UPI003CF9C6DC